jgi:hypothetical protein
LKPIDRTVTTGVHQGDHHTSGGATVTPAPTRRALTFFIAIAFTLLVATVRGDELTYQMSDLDFLSLDQPRVTIQMEYPVNSGQTFGGPIELFLDTGASGILFAPGAYNELAQLKVETRSDGSPVLYEEIGVAGNELLEVFQPHDFYFAGSDGNPFLLPAVRPFGSAAVDLGDINGLLGMPAMINRVTHLDLRTQLDPDLIGVSFQDAPSPATSPRYHVALQMIPPGFPGVDPDHPDDPKPTFAHNPFINGLAHTFVDHNGVSHTENATALLDTGAQTSLISRPFAEKLNINLDRTDPNTDIEDIDGDGTITIDDYLEIGGLGGNVNIPFVHLAKISVPTKEGTYISFKDVDVAVLIDFDGNTLDVAGIDAIFGMNMLDAGYFGALFGEQTALINEVQFDFRDLNNSEMLLDLNPDAIPEPGALGICGLSLGLLLRPKRKIVVA